MSRLLFAAARGARIEYKLWGTDKWAEKEAWGLSDTTEYRIHPKDAHLQYGPISTALRNPEWSFLDRSLCRRIAMEFSTEEHACWWLDSESELHSPYSC
jgi:hypothetical protein